MSGAGKQRDVRAERAGVAVPTALQGARRGHRSRCWCEKLAGGWEARPDPARGSREHDGLSELLLACVLSDHERQGRLFPPGKALFCLLIWLMKNADARCHVHGIGFSSEFSGLVPGEGRIRPQPAPCEGTEGVGSPQLSALSHIPVPHPIPILIPQGCWGHTGDDPGASSRSCPSPRPCCWRSPHKLHKRHGKHFLEPRQPRRTGTLRHTWCHPTLLSACPPRLLTPELWERAASITPQLLAGS